MDRRRFIKYAPFGVLAASSGIVYEENKMKQYDRRENSGRAEILVDLHTHPKRRSSIEELLSTFSKGVTGIADLLQIDRFLQFEDLLDIRGVKVVADRTFAEVHYQGKTGYIVKTQEVEGEFPLAQRSDVYFPHILAVGCSQRINDHQDPRTIIEDIHRQGGVVILNHPFVVPSRDKFVYRFINDDERFFMETQVLPMVDEVEVHNGQCVNVFGFNFEEGILGRFSAKKANYAAKVLIDDTRFKGTAASDTHSHLAQIRTSGIWIPEISATSIEGVKERIERHEFEREEHYVTLPSFLRGNFGYRIGL